MTYRELRRLDYLLDRFDDASAELAFKGGRDPLCHDEIDEASHYPARKGLIPSDNKAIIK